MKFWIEQFRSNQEAVWSAAEEVAYVSLLSLIPLFLLPFIDSMHGQKGTNLIIAAIDSGQLYLYSFAMFGTLFWLSQKEYSHIPRFPLKKWLSFAIIVPVFIILVAYVYDPALSKPIAGGLVIVSVIIYIVYLLLYFVLTALDNFKAPTVAETLLTASQDLIERLDRIKDE